MASVPATPKIYHITHIDNLPSILASMQLVSDANRIGSELTCSLVGMSTIKQRRLNEIQVLCHPDTKVGQYVPFYFCPRSVMLYILHKGNHPELTYRGGQEPMVHLEADLYTAINWATAKKMRWAFTDGNASACITKFYKKTADLIDLNWSAIASNNFGDSKVKEGKQAEFLMFDVFPWSLIEKIGIIDSTMAVKVKAILVSAGHQPTIAIEPSWYF
ncbi:MAG: DUF4433 domain-containing protein [Rhizonema sp. NSF051]|nr:DUF4433 domain-containing protein [Rhizonema sp. NSF051]